MSGWLCLIGEGGGRIYDVIPSSGRLYLCGHFSSNTFIGCLANDGLVWFKSTPIPKVDGFIFNKLCGLRNVIAVSGSFILGFLDYSGVFRKCWATFELDGEYHVINDICCAEDFVVTCNEDGLIVKASMDNVDGVAVSLESSGERNPLRLYSIYRSEGYAVAGSQLYYDNSILMLLDEDFNVRWCIDFTETREGLGLTYPSTVCLSGGHVYVCATPPSVSCFSLEGSFLWGRMLTDGDPKLLEECTPSMALDEEYLYLACSKYLVVLDRYSGGYVRGLEVNIEDGSAEISGVRAANGGLFICGCSNAGGFIVFLPRENIGEVKLRGLKLRDASSTLKLTEIHPNVRYINPIIEDEEPEFSVETLPEFREERPKIVFYGDFPEA